MAFLPWREAIEARGHDHDLNTDIANNNNIHLLPYFYAQSSQIIIRKYNDANVEAQLLLFVKFRGHKRPQEASLS